MDKKKISVLTRILLRMLQSGLESRQTARSGQLRARSLLIQTHVSQLLLLTAHAFHLSSTVLLAFRFLLSYSAVVVHLQLLSYISHSIGHTVHTLVLLYLLKQQQLLPVQ